MARANHHPPISSVNATQDGPAPLTASAVWILTSVRRNNNHVNIVAKIRLARSRVVVTPVLFLPMMASHVTMLTSVLATMSVNSSVRMIWAHTTVSVSTVM